MKTVVNVYTNFLDSERRIKEDGKREENGWWMLSWLSFFPLQPSAFGPATSHASTWFSDFGTRHDFAIAGNRC